MNYLIRRQRYRQLIKLFAIDLIPIICSIRIEAFLLSEIQKEFSAVVDVHVSRREKIQKSLVQGVAIKE